MTLKAGRATDGPGGVATGSSDPGMEGVGAAGLASSQPTMQSAIKSGRCLGFIAPPSEFLDSNGGRQIP